MPRPCPFSARRRHNSIQFISGSPRTMPKHCINRSATITVSIVFGRNEPSRQNTLNQINPSFQQVPLHTPLEYHHGPPCNSVKIFPISRAIFHVFFHFVPKTLITIEASSYPIDKPSNGPKYG
jgi:hypothetical protein